MGKKPELLLFGVDGMSFELTRALIEAKRLPNLRKLARESLFGPLRCTWPPHTATGWSSLVAGALPGEHGIFQFWECQNPNYEHQISPRTAIGVPTLLDALAEAGRDIGMVNLPMSHPLSQWPGYEITWPLSPTLRFFRPHEIFRELCGIGGNVRSDIMSMYDGSPDYPSRARAQVQARTRGMKYLAQTRPTSVLGVVYTEIDRVSHHYWHEFGPGLNGPSETDVVCEMYVEVDRALGQLLEIVGDDATVLVVSDHGFGPCSRGIGVHRMLSEGGFCAIRADLPHFEESFADHNGVGRLATSIEWSSTQFYMPTPGCFGINVNQRGRQREGIVPESSRGAAIAAVTEYLLSLKDSDRGGPLFSAVIPREIAYTGPFCESAPDLLLVPADPRVLLLADPRAPFIGGAGQTGIHALDGVYLLRSRRPTALSNTTSVGIEVLAGVLLDDLGIAAPLIRRHAATSSVPTFLPPGAFQLEASALQCVNRAETHRGTGHAPKPVLAPDASIEERLRFLGYW